ncbi:MAG: MFS transporter [Novosphingobium sp.]
MHQSAKSAVAAEWRIGWPVVLATFFGFSFLSLMAGSLSVFMEPLGREFGWSRTTLSLGMSLSNGISAFLSPVFGLAIDRFGSRRVALPGLVLTMLAIAAFSLLDGTLTQWVAFWAVYAFVSITVKATVWTAAVAGFFDKGRGLAMGLTLCGTAASQAILPPLAVWLIDTVGWRLAYVWLSFGWGGLTFALCWCFLKDARKVLPVRRSEGNVNPAEASVPGLTRAQAWRNPALVRIAVSTLIVMTVTGGLNLHQIQILTATGVSRTNAAWLASMAGIAGIAGKLITGTLMDRYRPNWVGGATLGATTLAFAFLVDGVASPVVIVVAMLVNGYTAGTKMQICGYLTARYGGLRHFGAIYGGMNSLIVLGTGLGQILAGATFDLTGAYTLFLIVGAVGCAGCGLLLVTLPAYPEWEKPEE